MYGVCVIVVQYENVLVSAGGLDRESSCLIGVGLADAVESFDGCHDVVCFLFLGRSGVLIRYRRCDGWRSCGTEVLEFLVEMTFGREGRFRKVLGY